MLLTKNLNKLLKKEKLQLICDKCGISFDRVYSTYIRIKEKYNGDYCKLCITRMINSTEEYKTNMSITLKRMWNNDREGTKEKFKNAHEQARRRMLNNNPMKSSETRKKVSNTRKVMFAENPEFKIETAQRTSDAWKKGKFDGVAVGKCKWYSYNHSSGKIFKVQGTWELAFIKWLDENNLKFTCHKGRLSYKLNGVDRNYYPDFYIEDWKCYVDIKAEFFHNKEKFNAILEYNPNIQIKILFKKDLIELGVM